MLLCNRSVRANARTRELYVTTKLVSLFLFYHWQKTIDHHEIIWIMPPWVVEARTACDACWGAWKGWDQTNTIWRSYISWFISPGNRVHDTWWFCAYLSTDISRARTQRNNIHAQKIDRSVVLDVLRAWSCRAYTNLRFQRLPNCIWLDRSSHMTSMADFRRDPEIYLNLISEWI